MIVVSVKRLTLSIVLIALSFLLFLAVSIDLYSGTALAESLEKQQILFWGIVTFLFQTVVFLSLFIDQRKLVSDLRKIASYKDLNHPQSAKILDQLGETGTLIHSILNDFNRLLEMRLNRITAFNKVLKIVCEEYPEPLLITDTLGSVLGISDKLSGALSLTMTSDTKLNDIFPEMKLAEILGSLEKSREPWKDLEETGRICTPVFDTSGNLNLCIWEFETSHFSQKIGGSPVNTISRRTINSFRGLLKRKPK
ncbi:MAG: hypothetical protein PQJ58_22900 [Spirochaetales bacterium]|nr:hypothetical protein [Spirochaetales bacterium]